MKKFRNLICISLVLVCCLAVLGGCFINNVVDNISLKTPVLALDSEDNTLSWDWDTDAKSYKLYDNESLLDTFTSKVLSVSVDDYLEDYKEYNFKVVAYVSDKVNKSSNVVKYLHKNPNVEKDAEYGKIVNNSNLAPTNVTYSNYNLTWNEVEDATKYYVCAIYSVDNIYSFETTQNSANVFNYLTSDVTAFRVASNFGDENSYFSNIVTVNLSDDEDIYKEVFYFNGAFHDYVVNSKQDLITIFYYSFISKSASVDFKLTKAGLIDVMGSETSLTEDIFSDYINGITETCSYRFSYRKFSMYKYRFSFDFLGVSTPTVKNDNFYAKGRKWVNTATSTIPKPTDYVGYVDIYYYENQSNLVKPYYENVNYTSRDNEFESTICDNKMVQVVCNTAEELYWTIESGASPVFTSTECKAYEVYSVAKDILKNVISDSMTEYEKTLSLFDYIAYNSVYDYKIINVADSVNPTKYTSFYLESLLNNDTSVDVAVCDGYSKTFSLLCNMEGIDCYRVTGMAATNGGFGAHAWNKVKVNNNWYVVDITWTEYAYATEPSINKTSKREINSTYEVLGHSYFLVNDEYVKEDHYGYASEDDRARFYSNYGANNYNNHFPSVYMHVRAHESKEYLSYFTNTKVGTYNMVVTSQTDLENLVNAMVENNISSGEFIVTNTVVNDLIIKNVITRKFGNNVTVLSIGNYEISSDTNSLSGKVYVFGNCEVTEKAPCHSAA